MLFIQECKLDDSFPDAQFDIPGYKLYRYDCTANMGGIMAYVRDDITQCRLSHMENIACVSGRIECLIIEIVVKSEKWLFCSMYKQPKVTDNDFKYVFDQFINDINSKYSNVVIVGDLNINMSRQSHCLNDIMNTYGLSNIIKSPTCYKSSVPTMIDVIISNQPKRLQGVTTIDTGLSDFHHMICCATKLHIPKRVPKTMFYRSYKHFNETKYQQDLMYAPFHVAEIFDNIDDVYWFQENLLKSIINENVPLKKRIVRNSQLPYMNSRLRREINYKNMLRRKFLRCKTTNNWERYRVHRNYVVKLRKLSMQNYMKAKCNVGSDSQAFWRTVGPLISDKRKQTNDNLSLVENDDIVNNKMKMCDIFNEYFANVVQDIGNDACIVGCSDGDIDSIVSTHCDHSSIKYIKEEIVANSSFSFSTVSTDIIFKKLQKLNPRKATGIDGIPPKLIKLGANQLTGPLHYIINKCILSGVFPTALKCAQVTPVFKKGDEWDKKNYRPISVLPCLSKILESVIREQLSTYFEKHFSPLLSGFRKGHSCEHVLYNFTETCKAAMDNNQVCCAVLSDLSKAFDCLPHQLLLAKFNAYGLDKLSCRLIAHYFMNRTQCVKLADVQSGMQVISKGAAQGSMFGPFAFNVLINDLLYIIEKLCPVYNYADDTSICCTASNFHEARHDAEHCTGVMMDWF